jgi:hypothetical protein
VKIWLWRYSRDGDGDGSGTGQDRTPRIREFVMKTLKFVSKLDYCGPSRNLTKRLDMEVEGLGLEFGRCWVGGVFVKKMKEMGEKRRRGEGR